MSLLSLLFALAVERSMSSKFWQLSFYVNHMIVFSQRSRLFKTPLDNIISSAMFILLPTVVVFGFSAFFNHSIFELLLSCAVLLICIGCQFTRTKYKCFLQSAFRGDLKLCEKEYQALLVNKNLPDIGLGQALIWLNFRYYIAVILIFIAFGPTAIVFYRLLITLVEYTPNESDVTNNTTQQKLSKLLFWVEWPLIRIVSFGYMLVGNFSKALPIWLENVFDFTKQPYILLSDVAKQSEDFQLDEDDCTAEPCLLVRLAKRSLMLLLAVIAILTITGVIY